MSENSSSVLNEVIKGFVAIAVAAMGAFVAYRSGQKDGALSPPAIVSAHQTAADPGAGSPTSNSVEAVAAAQPTPVEEDAEVVDNMATLSVGQDALVQAQQEVATLKDQLAEAKKPAIKYGISYAAAHRSTTIATAACITQIGAALKRDDVQPTVTKETYITVVWNNATTTFWCNPNGLVLAVTYDVQSVDAKNEANDYSFRLIEGLYPRS